MAFFMFYLIFIYFIAIIAIENLRISSLSPPFLGQRPNSILPAIGVLLLKKI
jgi:hypothetical protein